MFRNVNVSQNTMVLLHGDTPADKSRVVLGSGPVWLRAPRSETKRASRHLPFRQELHYSAVSVLRFRHSFCGGIGDGEFGRTRATSRGRPPPTLPRRRWLSQSQQQHVHRPPPLT